MASLIQYSYAIELSRQGSFVKAAKKCFVTQPTLSMQVQKLEEEFAVTIFDRSRKPIEPTAIGQRLLDQFQVVLEEHERVAQIARDAHDGLSGDYNLAILPTIAPQLLPGFLKRFTKAHPAVQITASELTTEQIVEQLLEGSIDAGILATPLPFRGVFESKLYDEQLCIFHSKEITLKSTDNVVRLADLPMEKLIVLTEGNCLRTQVLDLCQLEKTSREMTNFAVEASSLLTLLNLVEGGDFFTFIPKSAALNLTKSQLANQVKFLKGAQPVREISLVTHRAQIKSSIDQAAASTIRDLVSGSVAFEGRKNRLERLV